MELYTYFRSSAAYRVRIALNFKGIEHTLMPVNLLAGEQKNDIYRAINPQGLLPALKTDEGHVLTQSTAILEWLEQANPSPALLPKNEIDRALVRAMANTIACDIHPLNNLRVLKYLKNTLNVITDERSTWYHHWIEQGFATLEQQVEASPYCFGDQVTLADIYLIPQVYNALRFEVDMEPFPKIRNIYETCNKLKAFRDATPENQPDCVP